MQAVQQYRGIRGLVGDQAYKPWKHTANRVRLIVDERPRRIKLFLFRLERRIYAIYCDQHKGDYPMATVKTLLNVDANPKTIKGQKRGYLTGVLYLSPAKVSGYEVCPMSSAGCRAACLNTAGRAGIIKKGEKTNMIQQARIAKTRLFFEDRNRFMAILIKDIDAMIRKADRMGLTPCVRLNGTSDIVWEKVRVKGVTIYELFPDVQFYDYTKRYNRRDLPANLHLTFSLAEDNDVRAFQAFENGMNVAVVFFPDTRPAAFMSRRVFDGDTNDLRFLDPKGVVVGLKAKGKGRKDTSGFVR